MRFRYSFSKSQERTCWEIIFIMPLNSMAIAMMSKFFFESFCLKLRFEKSTLSTRSISSGDCET